MLPDTGTVASVDVTVSAPRMSLGLQDDRGLVQIILSEY